LDEDVFEVLLPWPVRLLQLSLENMLIVPPADGAPSRERLQAPSALTRGEALLQQSAILGPMGRMRALPPSRSVTTAPCTTRFGCALIAASGTHRP